MNSENGRQRAVEKFGWNDHVDRLVETFEKVVSGRAETGTARVTAP